MKVSVCAPALTGYWSDKVLIFGDLLLIKCAPDDLLPGVSRDFRPQSFLCLRLLFHSFHDYGVPMFSFVRIQSDFSNRDIIAKCQEGARAHY